MSKKRTQPTGKYPMGLFLAGLFTNIVYRHFYFCLAALLFLVAGLFWKPMCLYLAAAVAAFILARSLSMQMKFRNAALYGTDAKSRALREAIFSGDWKAGLQAWAESQKDKE